MADAPIDYRNPKLLLEPGMIKEGSVGWRSPSNLAIVKYWGKYGRQLPRNPSISFTLDKAYTETTLYYTPRKGGVSNGIVLSFYFEDRPNEAFAAKVRSYLESLLDLFPFLRQLDLVIRSRNSFPHSAGIASSASAMSALALCLCTMEKRFFGAPAEPEAFLRKASYLARLGSGSACRSVYPVMAAWGESGEIAGSSNLYAVPCADRLHPVFSRYHDDILIVSRGEKSVSSRSGHALMEENPFAEPRYQQARRHLHELLSVLATGDVERFGQIAEAEAMALHGLMMLSSPPYLLIKPHSVELIGRVQAFRHESGLPLYFSLDAGPNLHLLYPHEVSEAVQGFIKSELLPFCENGQWIADNAGNGPVEL